MLALGLSLTAPAQADLNLDLPVLGDTRSAAISLPQEHRLGQAWVKSLRGSTRLIEDPIVLSYSNDLLWQLVSHSELQDRRTELVLLDNQQVNAFAVPGGIIGLNGGLFLAAHAEDELASVVAHELAHLSQRHFASQLEESRRNRPLAIASILASIAIAATAGGEAGSAAISSTIASQQSLALAFSRQNEREADRVGMRNLVSANFDPSAMPRMFSRLHERNRLQGTKVPEFLLTHPLTESRIADSQNRAAQLGKPSAVNDSIDFDIIQARLQVRYRRNPLTALTQAQERLTKQDTAKNRYSVVVAALEANRIQEAREALKQLPANWQGHLFTKLTAAELDIADQQWQQSIEKLDKLAELYPGHYAILRLQADAYMGSSQPQLAVQALERLTNNYPSDVASWYLLAEAYGQAGQRHALHVARIEFFMLNGQAENALQQVRYARLERGLSFSDKARLDQLEKDAEQLREDLKFNFY